MASFKCVVLALFSLLSLASASVPIEFQQTATDDTSAAPTRKLQAVCRTRPFAQCGGKGLGGRKNGVWRCCPRGYYCKRYNFWWWSCQKRKGGRPAPKSKKKSPPKRRGPVPKINKRVKDGGAYNPNENDPCAKILDRMKAISHWCKLPKVKRNPTRPGLKVDRRTAYEGPVMKQLGYCGKILEGDEDKAAVAISTKYVAKNGWMFGTDPYCGKCMCIQLLGNDYWANPTPNPPSWKQEIGKVFKGVVRDMCPECCDDHLDILRDRGFCRAPETDRNPFGWKANQRASGKSWPVNLKHDESVGVWQIQWDWLDDCSQPCTKDFFRP